MWSTISKSFLYDQIYSENMQIIKQIKDGNHKYKKYFSIIGRYYFI